jgi:manganese efflux pump family protein
MELLFLAIGLSMDAFAVSIGLGSKIDRDLPKHSLIIALYFGGFQAIMPFIGYLAGVGLIGYIKEYDHWVAFVLLFIIGAKMIYESFSENIEEDIKQVTHKLLLILAIATSVDAMAAGFSLTLIPYSILTSIVTIGVITALFSYFGVKLGNGSGTFLESKAELLGGLILIAIGFKILLMHLFVTT